MKNDTNRGAVEVAPLAVLAAALCCGGPLLVVAVGAAIAAIGWMRGVGAGVVLLAAAVAIYRYRTASPREPIMEPRGSRSMQRGG